ncbi:MAG TPA: tetratricopeptide repeat protein, partial [Pirellulales bacterium]|nr:tetratricopeptide repeat protein [Pirellulales bacterium]
TLSALRRSFDVDQEEFEEGYLNYVKEIVANLAIERENNDAPPMTLAQLVRAHDEKPDDIGISARLAEAYVARKNYPDARKLAEKVLEAKPNDPLASYVLAKIRLVIGEDAEATALLEKAVDREHPEAKSLGLLASLKLAAQEYEEASELYRIAARTWPDDTQWTKSLAKLYLKTGADKQLAKVLAELAEADADDFIVRKKLAYLALEAKKYAEASRWASDALHVQVTDADLHRLWGEALVAQSQYPEAIDEYKTAISLDEKQPAWRFALADACIQSGDMKQARTVLKRLLELDEDYPGATLLLESLEESPAP